MNALPTVPAAVVALVIAGAAAATVRVRLVVWVRAGLLESVARKVNGVAITLTVGVPLIVPVELFRESPVGKVPLVKLHVKGVVPPVAASVAL